MRKDNYGNRYLLSYWGGGEAALFPTHEWPFKIVRDLFADNFSEVKKRLLKECGRNLFNFFKNRLAFSYQRHLNSTLAGNLTSHPIHTTERFNTLLVQYSIMTDKMQIIYRVLTSMPDSKRFLTKTKEMIYLN